MLVLPKQKAAFSNLNTYYLHLDRLLEHVQGEIGTGCLVFQSAVAGGVVYFDSDEVLNGYYFNRKETLHGQPAVNKLIDDKFDHNFTVHIYALPQEQVYFWSTIPSAEIRYKDLSTEFTDLEGLLKKMRAEKLTGFIDVTLRKNDEGGLIFFSGGEVVGGSFSWQTDFSASVQAGIDTLVRKSKQNGGVFQVSSIPTAAGAPKVPAAAVDAKVLTMLEEFLSIFETLYRSKRNRETDFNTLIRKKFVENAERFVFLDPFAAEFEYVDRRVVYNGAAQDAELANGVILSMLELADEIQLGRELRKYLNSWSKKYDARLNRLGIEL